MVQEGVQLDSGLGCPEPSPGEEGQAQVDNRGVKAEQLILEGELVPVGYGQAALIEFAEQGLKEDVGPAVVGVGKGGPCHGPGTEVVELPGRGVHAHDPVAQALPAGKLDMEQVDELVPAGEGAVPAGRLVLL